MSLHHTKIHRLAFAKYLYLVGVEQSKSPEIMASASLLTFHDSVEIFLQISAEHLNIGSSQPSFLEYWDFFSKKLSTDFPQKESMRRLNKARVSLKHSGTLPSKLDIESFRATTTAFFNDATKMVFNIEFDELSLTEFVDPEESREHLKKANEFIKNSSFQEASAEIALAFNKMIDWHENISKGDGFYSPLYFGKNMTFLSAFSMGMNKRDYGKVAEFIDATKESIESMRSALKILALGIDYRKYVKFKSNLPHVSRVVSGNYFTQSNGREKNLNEQYLRFCINFVIECSVILNEVSESVGS